MKCTTVVLFLLRTERTSNLIVCSGRKVPAILSAGVGLYENHLQMFCKEYVKCKFTFNMQTFTNVTFTFTFTIYESSPISLCQDPYREGRGSVRGETSFQTSKR